MTRNEYSFHSFLTCLQREVFAALTCVRAACVRAAIVSSHPYEKFTLTGLELELAALLLHQHIGEALGPQCSITKLMYNNGK
ncbi:hypothetical protein D3C77_511330 [compost metagenome]